MDDENEWEIQKANIVLVIDSQEQFEEESITLMGLKTAEPFLKIGNNMYKGSIQESIGQLYATDLNLENPVYVDRILKFHPCKIEKK
jgi:hypothetical protein